MASWADLPWTKSRTQTLRNQYTDGSPGSGDDPLGTHTLVAQVSMVKNLEELISRQEAGDKPTQGLQGELSIEIDPAVSYDENVARIKNAGDGSDFESQEKAARQSDRDRVEGEARQAALDHLVDECMRLQQEDAVDGIDALQIAAEGREPPVPGGAQLLDDVESIEDEFGFTVVSDAIARCEEMSRPDRGIEPDAAGVAEDQLLDRVESILGQRPASVENAFQLIEDRISNERAEARQNFLNRLSFAFSSDFGSVDEAVESIRDRVDRLAELDVRSGDIELVGRRDLPPRVSMEAGFLEFGDVVTEQVADAIDMTAAEARIQSGRYDAGTIRVVGDEPQVIDISPLAVNDAFRVTDPDALVRRFDTAVEIPDAVEPEVDPQTVTPPADAPDSEGDRLADQLLEGVNVD